MHVSISEKGRLNHIVANNPPFQSEPKCCSQQLKFMVCARHVCFQQFVNKLSSYDSQSLLVSFIKLFMCIYGIRAAVFHFIQSIRIINSSLFSVSFFSFLLFFSSSLLIIQDQQLRCLQHTTKYSKWIQRDSGVFMDYRRHSFKSCKSIS